MIGNTVAPQKNCLPAPDRVLSTDPHECESLCSSYCAICSLDQRPLYLALAAYFGQSAFSC